MTLNEVGRGEAEVERARRCVLLSIIPCNLPVECASRSDDWPWHVKADLKTFQLTGETVMTMMSAGGVH